MNERASAPSAEAVGPGRHRILKNTSREDSVGNLSCAHTVLYLPERMASPQIPREAACSPLLFPDLVCTMLISGRDVFKLLTRIAGLYVC